MNLKEVLSYWKEMGVFIIFIVTAAMGVIAYAEDQKVLMQAQAALMTNEIYQETRIDNKQLEIKENQRELENILNGIGDDEPTPRQAREIEYLDSEIARLRSEIETIRVELTNK